MEVHLEAYYIQYWQSNYFWLGKPDSWHGYLIYGRNVHIPIITWLTEYDTLLENS